MEAAERGCSGQAAAARRPIGSEGLRGEDCADPQAGLRGPKRQAALAWVPKLAFLSTWLPLLVLSVLSVNWR